MQTLAVGNSAGGCFVFPDICGAVRTRRCQGNSIYFFEK